MASLNKAMIIGNLTREPELRQTGTGKTVASFGVATSLTWNDAAGQKQEKTEFHNVIAWGKLADICSRYLHKGSKIYGEGRLQTSDWLKDGIKHYKTEIVLENMVMLSANPNAQAGGYNQGGSNYGQNNYNQQKPSYGPATQQAEPSINYQDFSVEDATPDDDIKVENIPF